MRIRKRTTWLQMVLGTVAALALLVSGCGGAGGGSADDRSQPVPPDVAAEFQKRGLGPAGGQSAPAQPAPPAPPGGPGG